MTVDPAMPEGEAWLGHARTVFAEFQAQSGYTVAMARGAAWMIDSVNAVCLPHEDETLIKAFLRGI